MSGHDLNRRAQKILQAIVAEYLQSGDAVGSRTITRRHELGLSPATVRNVMADLEDLGLLAQRHSSAGRVPTESGLRFFIDAMVKVRGLAPKEKEDIRARIVSTGNGDVVQRASQMLADLTHHAAVIVAPDPDQLRLGQLQFVPLRDGKLLAVLVTSDGRIENRLVSVDAAFDGRRLQWIHHYLNQLLVGLTLEEVRDRVLRELTDDRVAYDTAASEALRLSQQVFAVPDRGVQVVVTGQSNLANMVDNGNIDSSAEAQLTHMRDLLRTLEDKESLVKLLDRTRTGDGIQVFLGAETAMGALSASSVVAMPYGPDEAPIGAIAVIGPMRMNYAKVMSVVDFTAEVVTELLREK
jgi:heat-inducible transcriptional repressor